MHSQDSTLVQLPRGDTASFAEMQAYGETLQRFVREQEAELTNVHDVHRHNQIVDYLHLLASSYNEQLREFKLAEKRRQAALLLSLMRYVGG